MRSVVAVLLVAAGIGQPTPSSAPSSDPQSNPRPNPQSNPQSAIPNPQSALGRLVTVDVNVTDARGRTIIDLKPSDFELREGTALLPLESVRLVRVAAARQTQPLALIQAAAEERLAAGPA